MLVMILEKAPEEMEGRAVSLAVGDPPGSIPGQSQSEGSG